MQPSKVNLLDSIKQGATLRKPTERPLEARTPTSGLSFLDAIKAGASSKLRHVEGESPEEKRRNSPALGGFGTWLFMSQFSWSCGADMIVLAPVVDQEERRWRPFWSAASS
jgi:hypothetical protein